MTFLDLSRTDSRENLEKVLQKLKWTVFPGLQALLLKVTFYSFVAQPTIGNRDLQNNLLDNITPVQSKSVHADTFAWSSACMHV